MSLKQLEYVLAQLFLWRITGDEDGVEDLSDVVRLLVSYLDEERAAYLRGLHRVLMGDLKDTVER